MSDALVIRLKTPHGRGKRVLVGGTIAGLLLLVGQLAIEPSTLNLYCTMLVAISSAVTIAYCFREGLIQTFPVSTVAVLGYNVCTHSLALVAQTFDAKPLIYNLQSPAETFQATIILQAVILAAHITYTRVPALQRPSQFLARRVLMPLWLFRLPRQSELWILGFMGLAAIWVSQIIYASDIEYGNVGGKLLQAVTPFVVAPMFIPFRGLFLNRAVRNSPIMAPALVAYFAAVVITAVALNARSTFSTLLFDVILATIIMLAFRRITISTKLRGRLLLLTIVAIPISGFAQDLATAMTVARTVRNDVGPLQLVQETLNAFNDKDLLAREQQNDQGTLSGTFYSEAYISNAFLQRLTYTKYTDVVATASGRLSDSERPVIRAEFYRRVLATLPTPLLAVVGADLDKADFAYSMGDFYDSLAFGRGLYGFKTGSSVIESRDVFGVIWLPAMFIIFVSVFVILDSYCLRNGSNTIISPAIFILLFALFFRSLVSDSTSVIIDGITRGYVQTVFLYVILSSIARVAVAVALPQPAPVLALPSRRQV